MISMKTKEGIWGFEKDVSKLPQDGQRLIEYMEKKTGDDVEYISEHTANSWINNPNLKKRLKETIIQHLIRTGQVPLYFTAKFLISHDQKSHAYNHIKFLNDHKKYEFNEYHHQNSTKLKITNNRLIKLLDILKLK